ncbi:MAG: Uma2 family endonuclease [Thainema sp.]
MVAQAQASRTYSADEYFARELESKIRHEYIRGDMIPMTGGTPNHNRIIRNLCTALTMGLRGQSYEVFVADQRLWIPEPQIYTYPDVMVVAGELAYKEGRRDTITNPVLIIEVLSQSTRNDDRGDKFAAYRTILGFQEYILVDQYAYLVEHYAKTGEKQWVFQEYNQPDDTVEFAVMEFAIALADIYDKVEFEPAEPVESPESVQD